MGRISLYVKECYNELMHKVSWPTWSELQDSAIVVLVATLIFGFVVFLIDLVFQSGLNAIYNLFG
jgi:preprotein translocase subunit SecE